MRKQLLATLGFIFALGINGALADGIDSAPGTDLPISAGGTRSMTIQAGSGNVGIGTTSPKTKLDVAGDISVSGQAVINIESCPGNQVMKGITKGKPICVTQQYGGSYMSNVDGSCRYANPFTGGCSCPSGASAYGNYDFVNGGCANGYYSDGWRGSNCGIVGYTCIY